MTAVPFTMDVPTPARPVELADIPDETVVVIQQERVVDVPLTVEFASRPVEVGAGRPVELVATETGRPVELANVEVDSLVALAEVEMGRLAELTTVPEGTEISLC